MEIKTVMSLDAGVENLTLDMVKVLDIYEPTKGTGKVVNGKKLPDWHKQSFKVSDLSGEVILNTFKFTLDKNLIGKYIKISGIDISEYNGKKQLSCQGWEVVSLEPKQEPEKPSLKEVLSKPEVKPVDWDSKERRIIKQNALSHATAAVIAKHDRFNTVSDMVEQIRISAKEFELWVYSDNTEDAPF